MHALALCALSARFIKSNCTCHNYGRGLHSKRICGYGALWVIFYRGALT